MRRGRRPAHSSSAGCASHSGPRHPLDRSGPRERVSPHMSVIGQNLRPAAHVLASPVSTGLPWKKALREPKAEEGVLLKDIAATIGRDLNVPIASIPQEPAQEHFGFFVKRDPSGLQRANPGTTGWKPIGTAFSAISRACVISNQRPTWSLCNASRRPKARTPTTPRSSPATCCLLRSDGGRATCLIRARGGIGLASAR